MRAESLPTKRAAIDSDDLDKFEHHANALLSFKSQERLLVDSRCEECLKYIRDEKRESNEIQQLNTTVLEWCLIANATLNEHLLNEAIPLQKERILVDIRVKLQAQIFFTHEHLRDSIERIINFFISERIQDILNRKSNKFHKSLVRQKSKKIVHLQNQ